MDEPLGVGALTEEDLFRLEGLAAGASCGLWAWDAGSAPQDRQPVAAARTAVARRVPVLRRPRVLSGGDDGR